MKQDKETKNNLLKCARREFMDKGYMKASLRNICKQAGVTTGALYFFFRDKEDLFDALVRETVDAIFQVMQMHFQGENVLMQEGVGYTLSEQENTHDWEDSIRIIHMLYQYRDNILLVLTKSQGTKYENVVDRFIETAELHYRHMAESMRTAYPNHEVGEEFIHWLAHEQINAFIYMITHMEHEQEGMRFMMQFFTFMTSGWYALYEGEKEP